MIGERERELKESFHSLSVTSELNEATKQACNDNYNRKFVIGMKV